MKKLTYILILLGTIKGAAQQKAAMLAIGDEAPEFKVANWLKGDPGSGIEKGKVNVVEFWATWCAPCLANVPHLSKLTEEYKPKGVKVFAISVSERKGVGLDSLQRFIQTEKGISMHYLVGADDSLKYMATNWQRATGLGGIPFAMVVDRNGKIAWMGHPGIIDNALKQIVDGSWDLSKARTDFIENKRLDSIDNSTVMNMNRYMGKNYPGALKVVDSILAKEPALKYRHFTGHYTFIALLMTEPEKAVAFAKQMWAVSDFPEWKDASDMLSYAHSKNPKLPVSAYLLAADALQQQVDHYPWAMNFPVIYDEIASWQSLAGNRTKAVEYEMQAINAAKNDPKSTLEQLTKFQNNLNKYKD